LFSNFVIARYSPTLDRTHAPMCDDTRHRVFNHLVVAACPAWFKTLFQCLLNTAKGGYVLGIDALYGFAIRMMKQF
jgi:hypothetical protein